jgi:flagellar biosynthesis protein FliQ
MGQLNAFILYSINSAAGLTLIAGTFVSIIQALVRRCSLTLSFRS